MGFKLSLLLVAGLVAAAWAACPPTRDELKPVVATLEEEFDKIKPLKPGVDTADSLFVIEKVAKHIVTSSDYAPCNEGFDWNKDVSKDAENIRKSCYKSGDYSTKPVQDAFVKCAKGKFPPLMMRYAKPGLKACSCFEKDIIPNWDSKYKAKAQKYFKQYKDTKKA